MRKFKIIFVFALLLLLAGSASASWICGEVTYRDCEVTDGAKAVAKNLATGQEYSNILWDSDPPAFWITLPAGTYRVWIELAQSSECDHSSTINITVGETGTDIYLTVYGKTGNPH